MTQTELQSLELFKSVIESTKYYMDLAYIHKIQNSIMDIVYEIQEKYENKQFVVQKHIVQIHSLSVSSVPDGYDYSNIYTLKSIDYFVGYSSGFYVKSNEGLTYMTSEIKFL